MRTRVLAATWLTILAGVGALVVGQGSDSGPGPLTLLVSRGVGPAWKPLNPPADLNGQEKFTKKAEELFAKYPDDLRLDLGDFTVPLSSLESVFDSVSTKFYYDNDYDAVYANAVDFMHYGVSGSGLQLANDELAHLFMLNVDDGDRILALPVPSKVIEHNGESIELIAVDDLNNLGPLEGLRSYGKVTPAEEVIGAALESKDGPAILMSDFPPAENDAFAKKFPTLDMILEGSLEPGDKRQVGATWIVPIDSHLAIRRVVAERGPDGKIADVKTEDFPWISAEDYERLTNPALPVIGMSVQPPSRAAERLNVDPESVHLDVIRGASYPEFTTRKDIHVYHVEKDGERFRFYRVFNYPGRGWFNFDALVLMNQDHTIRGFVTNMPTYPLMNVDSKLAEILAGVVGKQPGEWTYDAELAKGHKPQVELVLGDLRKTIALDKILYPDGSSE